MVDKRRQEVIHGKEQQVLSDMKRFREIIQDNTAPGTWRESRCTCLSTGR